MVCKNCGAKLKGEPEKCPLCDYKFVKEKNSESKRKRGVGIYKNPFTPIYICTVLAVVVVFLCVVRFLDLKEPVWLAVLFAGTTVYFLICHTLLGMRNYTSKIAHLSHALCIYMIVMFEVSFFRLGYVYIYPVVQATFFLLSAALLFIRFKVFKPYISAFLAQTIFSYIPLVINIVCAQNYMVSLVITILETIFSIVITSIFPKEIINQLKRFFTA